MTNNKNGILKGDWKLGGSHFNEQQK